MMALSSTQALSATKVLSAKPAQAKARATFVCTASAVPRRSAVGLAAGAAALSLVADKAMADGFAIELKDNKGTLPPPKLTIGRRAGALGGNLRGGGKWNRSQTHLDCPCPP